MATRYEQFKVSLDVISKDLVPDSNVSYDLGHANFRWKDLYLSGSTIHLGAANISSSGGAIVLPSGSTVGGSTISTSSSGGGVSQELALAYSVALR